jgi:enediyne biosynthesis protein E4
MGNFTRREFLAALSAFPLLLPKRIVSSPSGFGHLLDGIGQPGAHPLFEQLPASTTGITWQHVNGRSAEYYLAETTGAGCAFFDYDNDGWMDIYLVNSGRCDFFDPKPPLRNALYRNNRDGTFTDVTEKAGVPGGGYGMGVAVADYNFDGFPDLYVTQYGRSILYRNNGDGTFTDVTDKAGVAAPGWASSAVWFDYDNDGKVDLFVCRFVDFDKSKNKFCGDARTGERYYCLPRVYEPMPSYLFHNNGDGTFRDVSEETGIAKVRGKAWGAVATDINNDNWMDLFIANDTVPNFLFVNRRGKFEEIGLAAEVAYSQDGRARSGMGVDSADYDQDGFQDLFVSNVDHEMYSIYHNNHDLTFDDLAFRLGIGSATRLMSGWGAKFFDYDNDGMIDLLVANGHPDDRIEQHSTQVTYQEPLLLFHNNGKGLENVSANAGPVFQLSFASRGLAVGDFDNNGALDVLVTVNNGAPILLKNLAAERNHWLGLDLMGRNCNPDAIGARITWQAGDLRRTCLKTGGGSFLSSHDPRVVLGLGARSKIEKLEIRWPLPSGRVETFTDIPVDRYVTVVEGKGFK